MDKPEGSIKFRRLAILLITAIVIGTSAVTILSAGRAIVPVQGFRNPYGSFVGGDFLVFYTAADTALQQSATAAYDPQYLNDREDQLAGQSTPDMPFFYPPIALFLWIPFAVLPYLPAFYAWLVATLGPLMLVLRRISGQWLVCAMVLASPLVLKAAVTGQSGNLVAALVGGALLLLNRNPVIAGILLGGLAFKPHLALALPICLAAGGHWRTFVSTGLTAASLAIASVAVFGVSSWAGFLENAQAHAGDYFSDDAELWHRIPTVVVSVQQLTGDATVAWTVHLITAVGSVATAAIIWRRSYDELARSTALAAAMFLATPKALYYDMGVFCIPMAYVATEAFRGVFHPPSLLFMAALWALPSFGELGQILGWQPGPLLLIAALVFAAVRVWREAHLPDREP